jgi:hypothetical protein
LSRAEWWANLKVDSERWVDWAVYVRWLARRGYWRGAFKSMNVDGTWRPWAPPGSLQRS